MIVIYGYNGEKLVLGLGWKTFNHFSLCIQRTSVVAFCIYYFSMQIGFAPHLFSICNLVFESSHNNIIYGIGYLSIRDYDSRNPSLQF